MGNDFCACNNPLDKHQNDLEQKLQNEASEPIHSKRKSKSIYAESHEQPHTHEAKLIAKEELLKQLTMIDDLTPELDTDSIPTNHNTLRKNFTLMPQLREHLITKGEQDHEEPPDTQPALDAAEDSESEQEEFDLVNVDTKSPSAADLDLEPTVLTAVQPSSPQSPPPHARQPHIFNTLCICAPTDEHLSRLFSSPRHEFSQCRSLTLIHCDLSLLHRQMTHDHFRSLCHLEIFNVQNKKGKKSKQVLLHKELYPLMGTILQQLAATLVSLRFECSMKYAYSFVRGRDNLPILQIPSNVEWLSLKNIGCVVDISKCHKLMAVQLLSNMKCAQMIWPKKDELISSGNDLIPLAVLCDSKGVNENEWREKCVRSELNVKYVCLLQEMSHANGVEVNVDVQKEGQQRRKGMSSRRVRYAYGEHEMVEKCKLDLRDERKCVVLRDEEIESGELYGKIVSLKCKNDIKLKSEKMMEYEDCEWVRNIGRLTYL